MKYSQFNHVTPIPNTSYCVLTNFWSGHFIRLNPFQKKLFDLAMDLPQDHPLVLRWKQAGFLTDRDEIGMIREHIREYYSEMDRSTDKVFRLMLHVTSACNYACPYCFQDRRGGEMSREVQDAIVRYIRLRFSTGRYRKLTVGWFGGEPLLAGEEFYAFILPELMKRFGRRVHISIQSNLWAMTDNLAELFRKYRVAAGSSLDGPQELCDRQRGAGYYARTKAGMEILHRHQMGTGIISTLTADYTDQAAFLFQASSQPYSLHGAVPPLG
ncbi:MAG: radical SAM protein, partial [Clostridia bacterium]|nr:radical SAM protein [Clostridia bacterium]